MKKEFNLSEKTQIFEGWHSKENRFFHISYVKEFIKRRNILDRKLRNNQITWAKYLDERRKLAGEDLI